MRACAVEALGLRVAGQDGSDFVELAMADGSKLELYELTADPAATGGR